MCLERLSKELWANGETSERSISEGETNTSGVSPQSRISSIGSPTPLSGPKIDDELTRQLLTSWDDPNGRNARVFAESQYPPAKLSGKKAAPIPQKEYGTREGAQKKMGE